MPKPASSGGLLLISGTCMKTTTQSGQAWRGYERAVAVIIGCNFKPLFMLLLCGSVFGQTGSVFQFFGSKVAAI